MFLFSIDIFSCPKNTNEVVHGFIAELQQCCQISIIIFFLFPSTSAACFSSLAGTEVFCWHLVAYRLANVARWSWLWHNEAVRGVLAAAQGNPRVPKNCLTFGPFEPMQF